MNIEKVKIRDKSTAANERFGATAAGRADLKGSAENPPLRQAAGRWLQCAGDNSLFEGLFFCDLGQQSEKFVNLQN